MKFLYGFFLSLYLLFEICLAFEQRYKIAHGHIADPESYPFVTKISMGERFKMNNKFGVCTGSLISRSVVITAGHCGGNFSASLKFNKTGKFLKLVAKIPSISNNEKYNLFNLLNSAHLLYGSEEMKHYKVYYAAEFYKKRDYEQELYETYRSSGKFHQLMTNEEISDVGEVYDIGLFALERPVPVNNSARIYRFIKLPVKDINATVWMPIDQPIRKLSCETLGYGAHERGYSDENLRRLGIKFHFKYKKTIFSPLLSYDQKGRRCQGDSGGPLICRLHNETFLFGITVGRVGGHGMFPYPVLERNCDGEKFDLLYTISTDLRDFLAAIRNLLIQMGKLDESETKTVYFLSFGYLQNYGLSKCVLPDIDSEHHLVSCSEHLTEHLTEYFNT
ncbi:unnamed protein product [Dracunculus medinensis]|uniref:Peptidase S1 domain-containing protein n=1 Tax=Dracunculus medinensis TaxID=318479 RepID=A0A0N4UP42_DRAME|nr:unnamed protein product [Dracunculus medinensis]